ncbi:hypothetical protein N7474_007185 [Penicillium riverlandense]|uniref:uncharacterized protein n=1 Tax=Penicillium riverlandense TaxID=1903569 RepID=UPI0025484472|nr:uncharacterized protein N7474_007185 [Penicillium riverlandense]KAJ5815408.1 hypothetical protein N7474_007185 [Penicillium riverlandense]
MVGWPLVLLATFAAASSASRKCWFPGENVQDTLGFPCTSEEGSACCGQDAICLTNGLCLNLQQPYVLSRGSCTDKSWTSNNCPKYCQSIAPDGGVSLVLLNFTNEGSYYCCNSILAGSDGNPICDNNQASFTVPDGDMIWGAAELTGYMKTSGMNADGNDTSVSMNNTSANTATSSGDSSKEIAIGVGVAVPLGVITLLSIAWALWERRKRKQVASSSASGRHYHTSDARPKPVFELHGSAPVELEGSDSAVGSHSNWT